VKSVIRVNTKTEPIPSTKLFAKVAKHSIANMSARISTILIVGGTAGIGEQFARRFHSLGKKVIVTGRNQNKLKELAAELSGLETRTVN
jgi:NADP-dependent 3-hydroxy acid dehydrogenase YdfG